MKKFMIKDLPGGAEFLDEAKKNAWEGARVFVLQVQNENQSDQTERSIVTTSKDLYLELGRLSVQMRSKFASLLEAMYKVGNDPQYTIDFSRSEKKEDQRKCGFVTRTQIGTAQITYTISPA